MISVYDVGNDNYDRIGNAVLCPISGKITQIAGGNYSLSMVHPLDPDGKWTHLVPGAIVKVPVPKETIENSFSGFDADIYKTNATADLREGPSAPQTISYPAWDINANYSVGDKVSNSGKNWQCTYFDETSQWASINPPNCSWWKQIASSTSGAAALVTLPAGTELYFVEDYNTTWYKMSTYYGLEGYILKSQVTFDRHVSASENLPRVITEQLFRIQEPSIDDDAQTVTVTGQHVSYDLAGTLISDVDIGQAAPAMAIGRMMDGLMIPYRGTIATNLTSGANGTYSGKLKGKNGIFALLDPDKGIVAAFDAKFTRDNWDLFVMAKTDRNLGFRLTYGRNVRGISWKRSDTSLVTRVVPVAKDEGGAELYLPEMWVDSSRINNYPVIKMEYLKVNGQVGKDDGTGTDTVWTESDLLDYMRDKAGERFSIDKADLIQEEVSIQIEMLGDSAEYAWLKSLEDVLLYDIIMVSNPDIGLETELRVTEIEFDIVKEKITGLKVSNVPNAAKRTITGYNVQNNSITPAKLTDEVTDGIVSQVHGMIPEYSNPDTWRPVQDNLNSTSTTDALSANQGKVLNDALQNIRANIAYIEDGTTYSRAYEVGQHVLRNGNIYRMKADVSSGATINENNHMIIITMGVIDSMGPVNLGTITTLSDLENTIPGMFASLKPNQMRECYFSNAGSSFGLFQWTGVWTGYAQRMNNSSNIFVHFIMISNTAEFIEVNGFIGGTLRQWKKPAYQ